MTDSSNELCLSDYRDLAEFRYQIRRFVHFSEQRARSAGIEPQQHQMLLAIKGLPDGRKATIGDLAERHSAVELIDRLKEHGYVERQRDEDDQRRVLVLLTTQGEELLEELSAMLLTELRMTGPTLVQVLSKLLTTRNQ